MDKTIGLAQWEAEIQLARGAGIQSFLRIGRALGAISEGSLWRSTPAKSFDEYCESTHGFRRSWAYGLIGVWDKFGPLLLEAPDLQSVEITRLVKLLPMVTEENREELVHMAATVPGVRAFEDNVRELQGKETTDSEHDHEFIPINWTQCKICGLKRKEKS